MTAQSAAAHSEERIGTMKKNADMPASRYHLSDAQNCACFPGCPADVVSMSFWLDTGLRRKIMKITVRNRGKRVITGMTVYAHYMNNAFENIGDTEGFLELRFTDIRCKPGRCTELPKMIRLAYQDIAAADMFIVSLTFADGSEEEYAPDDYVVLPRQRLLADVQTADECDQFRRRFGKRVVYVPRLPEDPADPWQCACGAANAGEVRRCSACGLGRHTARRLSSEKRRTAFLRGTRACGILARVIPILLAGILLIAACFFLWKRFDAFINSTPFGWRALETTGTAEATETVVVTEGGDTE